MSAPAAATATRRALAAAFAGALAYPYASPAPAVRRCAGEVAPASGEAAALLERLAELAEAAPLGELQEAYTRTFDLDTLLRSEPTCHLYVGHYLFDESHKRGAFILELRRRMRAEGFVEDGELADHLLVLLRFLEACGDEALADELVDDAILPALDRIALLPGAPAAGEPPTLRGAYLGALAALALALRAGRPAAPPAAELVEAEREWLRDRDSLGIERDWCGH